MKRLFRKIRTFVARSIRLLVGDLIDFAIHLSQAYEPIFFVSFFLMFGFASGLWSAAMISAFVITAFLCWHDFTQNSGRKRAAVAIFGAVSITWFIWISHRPQAPKTRQNESVISSPIAQAPEREHLAEL